MNFYGSSLNEEREDPADMNKELAILWHIYQKSILGKHFKDFSKYFV